MLINPMWAGLPARSAAGSFEGAVLVCLHRLPWPHCHRCPEAGRRMNPLLWIALVTAAIVFYLLFVVLGLIVLLSWAFWAE